MNTTEIERKKEKKLDRSHWMCRIQKFAFNIDAPTYYMGYCPFFWMTWLALLVSPFVALFNLVTIPATWAWVNTAEPVKEYRRTTREALESTPLQPSFAQMLQMQYMRDDELTGWDLWSPRAELFSNLTECKRIEVWLKQNPNWKKEWLAKAKAWDVAHIEAVHAYNKLKKVRAARLSKVNRLASTCGSAIFKVLIPLSIFLAVSGGGYGVYTIAIEISLASYVLALCILTLAAAAAVLANILWDALKTILDIRAKNKMAVEDDKIPTLTWWDKFCSKFSAVTEFIHDTVAITYKQECPLIIWGDETGPIQKRNKNTQ
jgi:hypothetical protein